MEKINPIILQAQQHMRDELRLRAELLDVIRNYVTEGYSECSEDYFMCTYPSLAVNVDDRIRWCVPKRVVLDTGGKPSSLVIDLVEEKGGMEFSRPLDEALLTVSELYSIYDAIERRKDYVTFSGLEVRRARAVAAAIRLLFENHLAPELEDMAITAGEMFSLLEKYTLFNDKTINPDDIWARINKVNSEGVKRIAEVVGVKDRDIVEVLGAAITLLKERGIMNEPTSLDIREFFDYSMGDHRRADALYELCVFHLLNAYVA